MTSCGCTQVRKLSIQLAVETMSNFAVRVLLTEVVQCTSRIYTLSALSTDENLIFHIDNIRCAFKKRFIEDRVFIWEDMQLVLIQGF